MKKTLAVILSVLMIVCCIPFSAGAAGEVELVGNIEVSASDWMLSQTNYSLTEGSLLTVPTGITMYVPSSTTLTIEAGATLRCYGQIVVYGSLVVEGFIEGDGASHIVTSGTGSATAVVRFPSDDALEKANLTGKVNISYGVTDEGNVYEDMTEDFDWETLEDSRSIPCNLNQYVHIKVEIVEDDLPFDKYDDSQMTVYVNGVEIPYGRGSSSFRLSTSVDVSFRHWQNDSDFLNRFKVHLPSDEGYAVYGREGEQSAVGETVELVYDQPFAFRVELAPEYDMSEYEVYVYDGYGWISLDPNNQDLSSITPLPPDEYGYYVIDHVKGPLQIQVTGVVKNETILMIGGLLDLVKNIFDMIAGFFQELLALFGLASGTETV